MLESNFNNEKLVKFSDNFLNWFITAFGRCLLVCFCKQLCSQILSHFNKHKIYASKAAWISSVFSHQLRNLFVNSKLRILQQNLALICLTETRQFKCLAKSKISVYVWPRTKSVLNFIHSSRGLQISLRKYCLEVICLQTCYC